MVDIGKILVAICDRVGQRFAVEHHVAEIGSASRNAVRWTTAR